MANDGARGREQESKPGASRGGGGQAWHGEGRFGARYDQERTGYQTAGYGGQEYGMEGGRDHRTTSERDRAWRGDEREAEGRGTEARGTGEREPWRPGHGEPYGEMDFNPSDRGIREFGPPADYAYHPHAGHEFDPDYLRWREQRMRSHDRDYREWRAKRQQRYDEEYRRRRGG